ncbi:TPA: hypothetical protein ACX6QE_003677 [Photobacterium damselae]
MPLTELKKLMKLYKKHKDDTPIGLLDTKDRCCAIQELISTCPEKLYAFIFFNENGESELFDALADERTSRCISNQIQTTKLFIITNDTKKVKCLKFIEKYNDNGSDKLEITPIPKQLAIEIIDETFDNEYFLAYPNHLIFIGRYFYNHDEGSVEKLAEVSSFLSFFDKSFVNTLQDFFNSTKNRVISGEFR